MSRNRLLAATAAISIVAAGLMTADTADAEESEHCSLLRLEAVDEAVDNNSVGYGSPDGSILIGSSLLDDLTSLPIAWRDGEFEWLDIDIDDVTLRAVNDAGTIIGEGVDYDFDTQSFIHEAGETTLLPERNGVDPILTGINAAGDLVGYDPDRHEALRWEPGVLDQPEVLPAPGHATARAISDDGTVVGNLGDAIDAERPYVWHPDGSHGPLPEPEGVENSRADSISGDQVGGWFRVDDEVDGGVQWDLTTGSATKLPESAGAVLDINSSGESVINLLETDQAAVFRDGEVVELPGSSPKQATYAATISEDGDVAGTERHGGSVWRGC